MIGIYPGSFDPITRGHLHIIRRALVFCPKLIVAIGTNVAKNNWFTPGERIDMINATLKDNFSSDEIMRITVTEFSGAVIPFAEKHGARIIVKGMRGQNDYAHEERMAIVNRRLSPEIDTVLLMTENDLRDVSSSAVREMARINITPDKFDHYLTPNIRDALLERVKTR